MKLHRAQGFAYDPLTQFNGINTIRASFHCTHRFLYVSLHQLRSSLKPVEYRAELGQLGAIVHRQAFVWRQDAGTSHAASFIDH
jgi:hypothetical protein